MNGFLEWTKNVIVEIFKATLETIIIVSKEICSVIFKIFQSIVARVATMTILEKIIIIILSIILLAFVISKLRGKSKR